MVDRYLRDAQRLIGEERLPDAVAALREARRIAVAQNCEDRLPEIADLARTISRQSSGRTHRQGDRLADRVSA
jgi:hypothetical protein